MGAEIKNNPFLFSTVCFYESKFKIWRLKLCSHPFKGLNECFVGFNGFNSDYWHHSFDWLCLSFQNSRIRKAIFGFHIRKYYSWKTKALGISPNERHVMYSILSLSLDHVADMNNDCGDWAFRFMHQSWQFSYWNWDLRFNRFPTV